LFLCLALAFAVTVLRANREDEIIKYTLYIGLNDQDTYRQEIESEEAEEIVTEIILRYADGFTRMWAKGAYKDGEGVVTFENTLIYEFLYTSDEQVNGIMDEVLLALNQSSILVETKRVDSKFYGGVQP
jgi:hypothetical protein